MLAYEASLGYHYLAMELSHIFIFHIHVKKLKTVRTVGAYENLFFVSY